MVVKLFDEAGAALRHPQRRLPAHPEVWFPRWRQRVRWLHVELLDRPDVEDGGIRGGRRPRETRDSYENRAQARFFFALCVLGSSATRPRADRTGGWNDGSDLGDRRCGLHRLAYLRRLLGAGQDVVVVDDLSNASYEAVRRIEGARRQAP